jgi:hypothetical protein
MRILVSVDDVDSKRLTKVAKALKKHWPLAPTTLMQAQNNLATLLGYRDLHDLQGHLLKYINPQPCKPYSRTSVKEALSWDLFRKHRLSLDQAYTLASALPLQILDFDVQTSEAHEEAMTKKMAEQGHFVFFDEYAYYSQPFWFERTPELLQAGAPAHQFVILPNGQAIRWARLVTLAQRLPQDLVTRLRAEGRYKAFKHDSDLLAAFYREEILPVAPERLSVAIEEGWELPLGFQLKQYGFDKKGLVLENTDLGGVVPVVFSDRSRRVFQASASLMQGLPVELEDNAFLISGDHIFEMPGEDATPISAGWRVIAFLTSSFASAAPGVSATFFERGQRYWRTYEWLDMDSVPDILKGWYESSPAVDSLPSELAMPVWHLDFHERTQQLISTLSTQAKGRNSEAVEDGRLAALIMSYVVHLPAASLDILPRLTRKYLGVPDPRLEMGRAECAERQAEQQQDLDRALAHYLALGQQIVEALPALANLSPLTLGWLWYAHHDEHFESRNAYMVPDFNSKNSRDIRAYLGFLAFHFCTQKVSTSVSNDSQHGDSDAMRIVLDLVLSGHLQEDQLVSQYHRLSYFFNSIERQHKHIAKVQQWRTKMDDVDAVREGGQYLYARGRVSPVREESWLSKSFRESRKIGGALFNATQEFGDLGDEVKLAALLAKAQSLALDSPPESVIGPYPDLKDQTASDEKEVS